MKHFKRHYNLTGPWVTCTYHTTILPISHSLADASYRSQPVQCGTHMHAPFLDHIYAITVQLVHAHPSPCMLMCLLFIHYIGLAIQPGGQKHGQNKGRVAHEWHVNQVEWHGQHAIINGPMPMMQDSHGCALSMQYRSPATWCPQTRAWHESSDILAKC